jgi:hypothetical protein
MVPNYLANLQCVKTSQQIVSNLKSGFTEHLVGQQKSQIVVAKDIVYMSALSESIGSYRGLAKVFGVDKHNIQRAMGRHIQLDTTCDVF